MLMTYNNFVTADVLQSRWKTLKNSYSNEKSKIKAELSKCDAAGPAKKKA